MKNILVIGGSGFLGRYVTSCLIKNDYSVRVLDQEKSEQGEPHYKGSLFDSALLNEAVSWSDMVVHLAAIANVNFVKSNPKECLHVNINGTIEILEAIRTIKIQPIIFSSTYFVCADSGGGLYASSKLACENFLKDYSSMYNFDVRIVRLGSLYGEFSRGDDVITKFSKSMLQRNEINIFGSGSQSRAYIHGIDAAEGIHSVVNYPQHKGGFNLFYILGNEFLTISQISEKFNAISPNLKINHTGQREYDVNKILINQDSINVSNSNLKWKPGISIDSGIRRVVDYLR